MCLPVLFAFDKTRNCIQIVCVCAIHYDTGKVFLLRFLTHAEYDKDRWKDEL